MKRRPVIVFGAPDDRPRRGSEKGTDEPTHTASRAVSPDLDPRHVHDRHGDALALQADTQSQLATARPFEEPLCNPPALILRRKAFDVKKIPRSG